MLPKVVVMDLGGTILKNLSISFDSGLTYLYKHYCIHEMPLETLLKDNQLIWDCCYNKRDNDDFEINFHNYLNYIDKTIGFREKYDYYELEKNFIDQACIDEKIDNVENLLKIFKESSIDVYVLSNSCFSSYALSYQLEKQDLKKYIKGVFSSADYLMRKPNKLFFNVAFNYIKRQFKDLYSKDIWYIGNEYRYDMEGANLFNVTTIWLNENHQKPASNKKIVDLEIDNYQKLISYLLKEIANETIR